MGGLHQLGDRMGERDTQSAGELRTLARQLRLRYVYRRWRGPVFDAIKERTSHDEAKTQCAAYARWYYSWLNYCTELEGISHGASNN